VFAATRSRRSEVPCRLLSSEFCILNSSLPAFTLIELLTVIAIIGILAALTLGAGHYAREKAKNSRARAEIAAMENALEGFKNDHGSYPQRLVGPDDLYSSTNIYNALAAGPKTYMTFRSNQLSVVTIAGQLCTNVLDPFGIPYRYLCPGTNNAVSFDLWSLGSDKTNDFFAGTDHGIDDVTNWKQN
jgi:general secretion pathway protein G